MKWFRICEHRTSRVTSIVMFIIINFIFLRLSLSMVQICILLITDRDFQPDVIPMIRTMRWFYDLIALITIYKRICQAMLNIRLAFLLRSLAISIFILLCVIFWHFSINFLIIINSFIPSFGKSVDQSLTGHQSSHHIMLIFFRILS